MKCEKCGIETYMPFQCPYCGGQFCGTHRLPEAHSCVRLDLARAKKQEVMQNSQPPSTYEYTISYGQPNYAQRRPKGRVYFSPKELQHLAVAVVLVVAVGLLSGLYSGIFGTTVPVPILDLTIILSVSFFLHEIAHKVTAQRNGLWSEFRLTLWGSVLTAVSAISPLFKIISPGAVMIAGPAQSKDIAKISIAGPVTNIILSIALFGASFLNTPFSFSLLYGGFFNAFIAFLNLIPFAILDGLKIFNWNKRVWATVFVPAVILLALTYLLL
jgi:Zn-dependent protease